MYKDIQSSRKQLIMRNNEIAIIKVRLLHKNLPTRSNVKIILIALEQFVKMHKKKTDSRKQVPFLPSRYWTQSYTIKTRATLNNQSPSDKYETQLGWAECRQC